MNGEKYYKLIECILRNYKDGEEFLPEDIEKKAEMKYITTNTYLKKIITKYPECIKRDKRRVPHEFTLLNRKLLIESLLKDLIPGFLEEYIIIKINLNED